MPSNLPDPPSHLAASRPSPPDPGAQPPSSFRRGRPPRRRHMATAALIPLARKSRDKLTVAEVCEDLQVAQNTFYEWRTKGTGPRCIKLPNGQLRVRRSDLEAWLDAREDAA